MRRYCVTIAAGSLLVASAVACGGSAETPESTTTVDGEVRALTREQIRESAEAMSPEMAESLGIVDTTIRIESPIPAESVRMTPPPPDSTVPAL